VNPLTKELIMGCASCIDNNSDIYIIALYNGHLYTPYKVHTYIKFYKNDDMIRCFSTWFNQQTHAYDFCPEITNLIFTYLPKTIRLVAKNINKLYDMFFYSRYYINFNKVQGVLKNTNKIQRIKKYNGKFDLSQFVTLKYLHLEWNYNKDIILSPQTITTIVMGSKYNSRIILPLNLEYLKMGMSFNQYIVLNTNLRTLILGNMYNKPLDIKNIELYELILGKTYNKTIILPDTLKYLRLGHLYNKELILPPSLIFFMMGYSFNQYIECPYTLQKLYMGYKYNSVITVPNTIKQFTRGASCINENILYYN
jgi:hypothetical protein